MRSMINRLSTKIKEEQSENSEKNMFALPDHLESSNDNPFNLKNININESQNSNGFFQINVFQQPGILDSGSFSNNSGLILGPKMSKADSKMQGSVQEQSIRKEKQILGLVYNRNYFNSYNKPLSQILGNQNSQQIRKCRFKAYRLKYFQKEKVEKEQVQKQNYEQYLMRLIQNCTIYLYQMKKTSIQLMKPIILHLKQEINQSMEYDSNTSRLFCFSNHTQQVVIFSLKMKEQICRVKIKYKRINPELLLHNYKGKEFLLVIGGYQKKGSQVQGSKFIQIFLIDKWQISLKQKTLRLNIGRIYPIVFTYNINQQTSIFILGGNSNASFSANKKNIQFDRCEDINFSTNQTGINIPSSFIYDTFFKEEDNFFILNKLDVRFEDPLQLYNGSVLVRRENNGNQKLQLFLANRNAILDLKILKGQINIYQSQLLMDYSSRDRLGLKIGYYRKEEDIHLLRLNKEGKIKEINIHMKTKNEVEGRCILM